MTVTDRAIFLLSQFQIPMTENEYIGLRLTDGLYEEANKSYYISWNPDWGLKSNIAFILHQADSMATHIEADIWKRGEDAEQKEEKVHLDNIRTATKVESSEKTEDVDMKKRSQDLFDELFGGKK